MIPQSFIQDLLQRVDVVDVVDRHVKLKRAGANYSACCPFHSEKTPSFTVSATKQFYHCFGCGAHGTAIGFLMEYSGLGFPEAVKDLAQSVGMKVPEEDVKSPQRKGETDDLYAILLTAAHYYRTRLRDAPQAIEYLKQRGLSGEVAKRFGIGYAPDGWQSLGEAFPDYTAKGLMSAGLVKQNDEGKRYDVFRDRIVFPIVDVRGNVIGFGGRVLQDAGAADRKGAAGPKYLNSPETPVFEKGRELYGLYQARRAIRDAGRVMVVEGYMDVVALAQHGIGYAVATLGTATTAVHVQKLLRQADEVVYCFDGDDAGRRAAWRALENSLPHLVDGKQMRFLFLPQGEDPDSYVRRHGKEAFEALIGQGTPLSRFLLEDLAGRVDLSSAEGRANLVHLAKPLVKQLAANNFRLQIVRELAAKARLAAHEVEALCELPSSEQRRPEAPPPARATRAPPTTHATTLLRVLLSNPALAQQISAERRELLGGEPDFAAVQALLDDISETGASTAAALMEATRSSQYAELYQRESGADMNAEPVEGSGLADLEGIFGKLEDAHVNEELARMLAAGVQPGDRQRFEKLQARQRELKGVRRVGIPAPAQDDGTRG
jgi:DNA primase